MATELERLLVKIDGDISGLRTQLTAAVAVTGKAGTQMEKSFGSMNRAITQATAALRVLSPLLGIATVAGLSKATKESLAFASSIKDTAAAADLGTEALQELRFVGTQFGLETAVTDKALEKMTVNLGRARAEGGEAAKVFRQIGYDISQVASGDEAFLRIVELLGKIEDPAVRAARAFEIFGKEAGPKFRQLVDAGAERIRVLRQAARDLGAVIDDDIVQNTASANDQLAKMNMILDAQLTQTLANLAPALIAIAGVMASLAKATREAGEGIGILLGKMMVGSDVPFEQDLIDAQKEASGLRETIERLLDIVEQDPTKGVKYGPILDSLDAKLQVVEARILELQRLQGEYFAMKPPAAAQAEEKAPIVAPPEVLQKQRALLRQLGVEVAEAAKDMSGRVVANFLDMDSGIQVSLQQALDYSRNYFADEAAIENARHEQQLEEFQKQADELMLSAEDRTQGLQLIESAHQARMLEITAEGEAARRVIEDAAMQQRLQVAKSMLGNLATLMSSHSRKAFEVGKTAAIAETLISTYEAAQHAFKWGTKIGGPYLGAAFAATAVIAGLARVQAIKSTSFGSRSVAVGVGGGGSLSVGSEAGGQTGGQGRGNRVIVMLPPGMNWYNQDFLRDFAERLSEAAGDGSEIEVVS